ATNSRHARLSSLRQTQLRRLVEQSDDPAKHSRHPGCLSINDRRSHRCEDSKFCSTRYQSRAGSGAGQVTGFLRSTWDLAIVPGERSSKEMTLTSRSEASQAAVSCSTWRNGSTGFPSRKYSHQWVTRTVSDWLRTAHLISSSMPSVERLHE